MNCPKAPEAMGYSGEKGRGQLRAEMSASPESPGVSFEEQSVSLFHVNVKSCSLYKVNISCKIQLFNIF